MKLKICGMKYLENMQDVVSLAPDFVGFIFYEKSPRYMVESLDPENVKNLPSTVKKVGVFVNQAEEFILKQVDLYGLNYVQLHGHESVAMCQLFSEKGIGVIKVFHIDESIDWRQLEAYEKYVDYYLFDTKSKNYGGTGKQFDWKVLSAYALNTPYFISGGIDLTNVDEVGLLHRKPYALDVNSRFELSPGLKDVNKLKILKQKSSTIY